MFRWPRHELGNCQIRVTYGPQCYLAYRMEILFGKYHTYYVRVVLALKTCNQECSIRIYAGKLHFQTDIFCGFPQLLQANAEIEPRVYHKQFLPCSCDWSITNNLLYVVLFRDTLLNYPRIITAFSEHFYSSLLTKYTYVLEGITCIKLLFLPLWIS
jgi:hypothetical protein